MVNQVHAEFNTIILPPPQSANVLLWYRGSPQHRASLAAVPRSCTTTAHALQEGKSAGCSKPVQEERAGIPRKGPGKMTAKALLWTTQEPACKSTHTQGMLS